MSFQGSLKELHLPDVIQLVSVSGKSGSFRLEKDGLEGFIYLENGRMVHATLGKFAGEEAVYALATWNDGSFRFIPGDVPPERTITKSNTNVLMEAARRIDEWRVLSKRIPSLDRIPRFQVPEGKQGQINLNTQEWLILSKINGKASIEEIAVALSLSTFEVAKLLYGLVTMGLIVLDEPSPKAPSDHAQLDPIGPETGAQVTQELMKLVQRLREEAEGCMGEVGWPMILKAYRQAKVDLEGGAGTEAIQKMCQDILGNSAHMEGPETQRHLAERFRDILANWNSPAP
jgi:hypothetical protein